MENLEGEDPIALEAYEILADSYAAHIDTKPHNAYYERPAMLALLPEVRDKRVLDAGCGSGLYAEWFVEHGAEVVAVDVSPKMVEHARRRVGGRVEVILANLTKPLDFLEDHSFDIVFASLAMDYIRNWAPVLEEFHRVLREAGHFLFSSGHPFAEFVLSGKENYFTTELTEMVWRGFPGVEVRMPAYRRPLEDMVLPVVDAGFVVERVVEPRPTEDFKRAQPDDYEELCRRPGFICIRARKV